MKYGLSVILIMTSLVSACDLSPEKGKKTVTDTDTTNTGSDTGAVTSTGAGTSTTTTGTNTGTNISVSVKDTAEAPPLQDNVPATTDIDGWLISQNTPVGDLPSDLPADNKAFYKALKAIGGNDHTIEVVFGDITKEKVDAIVNAANTSLEGGGGIDFKIHKAAEIDGKDLMKEEAIEYKNLHNKPFITGSAMVTNSYGLEPNINMVVHTAGPNLQGTSGGPTKQNKIELYSAIYNSLLKASDYGAKSVSIPAVSTAIFAYPIDQAIPLYFKAVLQFFKDKPKTSIYDVRFVFFSKRDLEAARKAFLDIFQR